MGRYRWRTWLRGNLPDPASALFPKPTRDCVEHEWYNCDNVIDHCYHCAVGVPPHETRESRQEASEPM